MLLESWKSLRWLLLFLSVGAWLLVFFLFDPTHQFGIAFMRANWCPFFYAWAALEAAMHFFRNNGRIKKKVKRRANQVIVFITGLHPFVLGNRFRTHHDVLEDADRRGVLPPKNTGRLPFKWYAIWVPFWLGTATLLYYIGFVMSVVATSPTTLPIALEPVRAFFSASLVGPWVNWLASPIDAVLVAIPNLLLWAHGLVRENPLLVFETLGITWVAFYIIGRFTRTRLHVLATTARIVRWSTVLVTFFAVLSTPFFDWLAPMYSFLPSWGVSNGWMSAGFLPLTISPMFFFPDTVDWASYRIVLIRNTKSFNASLLVVWGVLVKGEDDLSLERVVNKGFFLSIFQRIFRIGDVKVLETGGGEDGRVIRSVWDPEALSDAIKDCIDDNREHQHGTVD